MIARDSICADGASRALGAGGRVAADPALTEELIDCAAAARAGTIISVDLFYEVSEERRAKEALAVEMEAATLFAVGARAQVPVGCVLAVTDTFDDSGARNRIDDHSLHAAAAAMGAVALRAISR